jgi:hypothetical protein
MFDDGLPLCFLRPSPMHLRSRHPRERRLMQDVLAANPLLTPEQALAMLRNAGM